MKVSLVNVLMTLLTQGHQEIRQRLTAVTVALDMVDFQPQTIRAPRDRTAVTVPPEKPRSLRLAGVTGVGIEIEGGQKVVERLGAVGMATVEEPVYTDLGLGLREVKFIRRDFCGLKQWWHGYPRFRRTRACWGALQRLHVES